MCNVFPGEGKQPFKLEEYTIIFPNCSRVVFIMSGAQVPPPQKKLRGVPRISYGWMTNSSSE